MTKEKMTVRDTLALERTKLANMRTLMAFIRTSLYFFIAGLTIYKINVFEGDATIPIILFICGGIVLITGIIRFYRTNAKFKNLFTLE